MPMNNAHVMIKTGGTHARGGRQTPWHRSHRHREYRTKTRRMTIHHQPANAEFFQNYLFPKLALLFKRMLIDLPDYEREDAEQDCLCQSWLVYKKLPAPLAEKLSAEQLAEKIYRAYRFGGRFLALA